MSPRKLDELGVLREKLVHARLHVEARLDAVADDAAPLGRQTSAGHGDADERGGGLRAEREAVRDRGDDGNAVERRPGPRRVDYRNGPYWMTPRAVFP